MYPSTLCAQVGRRERLTWAGTFRIMDYDPLAPVARYRQIAEIIAGRIERGEIEPNRPIPSEQQVMQEFGVARDTVRHAVEVLRERGLVITVPGIGTFVVPKDQRR